MKKESFYPAKIIGKFKPKQEKDKPPDNDAGEKDTAQKTGGPDAAPLADPPADQAASSVRAENSPLMSIMSRFTGEGDAGPESPFTTIMNGTLNSLRGRAIHDIAQDIKEVIVMSVSHALLIIGYYLLVLFFDSDENKALSKNPFKGTSLNELARHRDMPFGRQRLGECVRAAAVDMELRKRGRTLCLTFYLLNEIARIKTPEVRVEIAEEAFAKKLTLSEVKKRVDQLLGKSSSEDKRLGRAVLRKLADLARLSTDEETQQFLMNKTRLKAAFGTQETVKLLEHSKQFRKGLAQSEKLLKTLESSLADIVVEKTKTDEENPDSVGTSFSISKTS